MLEFLPEFIDALNTDGYTLTEAEASIFLPCLIEKVTWGEMFCDCSSLFFCFPTIFYSKISLLSIKDWVSSYVLSPDSVGPLLYFLLLSFA